jgi:hypothetical protein
MRLTKPIFGSVATIESRGALLDQAIGRIIPTAYRSRAVERAFAAPDSVEVARDDRPSFAKAREDSWRISLRQTAKIKREAELS